MQIQVKIIERKKERGKETHFLNACFKLLTKIKASTCSIHLVTIPMHASYTLTFHHPDDFCPSKQFIQVVTENTSSQMNTLLPTVTLNFLELCQHSYRLQQKLINICGNKVLYGY